MSKKDIAERLLRGLSKFALQDQTEWKYEKALTDFIHSLSSDKNQSTTEHLLIYQALIELISNQQNTEDIRFAAMYAYSIITRDFYDYSRFTEDIKPHRRYFMNQPMFSHIENVHYLVSGIPDAIQDQVMESARLNYQNNHNHAGVAHCYADICATIIENRMLGQSLLEAIQLPNLNSAIEAVDTAIEQSNHTYPKYLCTKARLLANKGEFPQAVRLIQIAIDKEQSEKKNYLSKIQYYQFHLQRIKQNCLIYNQQTQLVETKQNLNQMKDEWDNQVKEMRHEFEQLNKDAIFKNIQVITFFSGTIGLIITGIQITANHSAYDASRLIIILFASFLAVYSLFDLILTSHNKHHWARYIPNTLSILLSIGTIFLFFFWRF